MRLHVQEKFKGDADTTPETMLGSLAPVDSGLIDRLLKIQSEKIVDECVNYLECPMSESKRSTIEKVPAYLFDLADVTVAFSFEHFALTAPFFYKRYGRSRPFYVVKKKGVPTGVFYQSLHCVFNKSNAKKTQKCPRTAEIYVNCNTKEIRLWFSAEQHSHSVQEFGECQCDINLRKKMSEIRGQSCAVTDILMPEEVSEGLPTNIDDMFPPGASLAFETAGRQSTVQRMNIDALCSSAQNSSAYLNGPIIDTMLMEDLVTVNCVTNASIKRFKVVLLGAEEFFLATKALSELTTKQRKKRRINEVSTTEPTEDYLAQDFLLFPVCFRAHWILVIFSGLKYLKSTEDARTGKAYCIVLNSLVKMFTWTDYDEIKKTLIWFIQQHTTKGFQESLDESKITLVNLKVPQQSNCVDCGVYVIFFARCFLRNPGLFQEPRNLQTADGKYDPYVFNMDRFQQRKDIARKIFDLLKKQTDVLSSDKAYMKAVEVSKAQMGRDMNEEKVDKNGDVHIDIL